MTHPAKFDTVVEPLIGRPVPVPDSLADILKRPTQVTEIPPEPSALEKELR